MVKMQNPRFLVFAALWASIAWLPAPSVATELLEAKVLFLPPDWFTVDQEFEPACVFASNPAAVNYNVSFAYNNAIIATFYVTGDTASWRRGAQVEGVTVVSAAWDPADKAFYPTIVSSHVGGSYSCAVTLPAPGCGGDGSDPELPPGSVSRYFSDSWNALSVQLPPKVNVTYHHDPYIYIDQGQIFEGICTVNMSLAHASVDYTVQITTIKYMSGISGHSSSHFRVKASPTGGSPTVTFDVSGKPAWGNVFRGTSRYPTFSVLFEPTESTRLAQQFGCTVYIDLPGGGEATYKSNQLVFGN